MKWLSIKHHPFPKGEFLAAWIDKDDEIAQIEWYTYLGGATFMNVNSSNINEFDPTNINLIRQPPNYWIPVPFTDKQFYAELEKTCEPKWGDIDSLSDEEFVDGLVATDIIDADAREDAIKALKDEE